MIILVDPAFMLLLKLAKFDTRIIKFLPTMNKPMHIQKSFSSPHAFLRVLLSLSLLAFPLTHAWADDYVPELQLVGGDSKAFLRATFLDGAHPNENKSATLTFAPLLPWESSLTSNELIINGLAQGTSSLGTSASLEGNTFQIWHSSNLGKPVFTREAEFVDRLQFMIPATPERPFGTRVLAGLSAEIYDIGPIPGNISLVDGRPPAFVARFANQTLDLSQGGRGELTGIVQTGVPFSVELDWLATYRYTDGGYRPYCTMKVTADGRPNQTITSFSPPSVWGLVSIELQATASSLLPVEFSVVSGPATIAGNILTPTGPGSVVVRASQSGNNSFTAAIPVDRTITIEDGVAVVKMLRGSGTVHLGGSVKQLKYDDWVGSGAIVKTGEKSFVRLVFIDKSLMNLGSNSEMKIERFSGDDASIIDLIKGQIRSEISKDYLQQRNKTKSKMFVKTPDAVMGIRGTEFDLSYTIRNGIGTTVIQMIEGLVEAQDLTTGKITMLKDQDRLQVKAPAIVPELALFDRSGKRLARGATAPHFGAVVPKASKSVKFEIRNLGIADLTDIKPVIRGRHAREFRIIKQPKSKLEPEEKSAFTIRFSPKSAGPRSAILQIASSDPEGKPYEVILKGDGIAATPNLVVEWPAGSQVSNGDSRKLGTAVVGLGGSTRTVTLRNTGARPLTGIRATMVGSHPGDFQVGKLPSSIPPGAKVIFNVTFQPKALGPRSAVMEIRSNDPKAPIFQIQVNGVGGVLK